MTSEVVGTPKDEKRPGRQPPAEQAAAAAMVAGARARGLELTGPDGQFAVKLITDQQVLLEIVERMRNDPYYLDGLLKLFTKNVLETALGEDMTEHLGHENNRADSDRESANIRNGSRSKTVVSDAVGEVDIVVPRDRDSTFESQLVRNRQRRLGDVDESCFICMRRL